jgi:hypothetical protein
LVSARRAIDVRANRYGDHVTGGRDGRRPRVNAYERAWTSVTVSAALLGITIGFVVIAMSDPRLAIAVLIVIAVASHVRERLRVSGDAAMQMTTSSRQQVRMIDARQVYLEALEERDPAGLARWLDAEPRTDRILSIFLNASVAQERSDRRQPRDGAPT